jgi:hypothetical protein
MFANRTVRITMTNNNLDSMKYEYSVVPSKTFPDAFRTHADIVSSTEPKFDYTWHRLSDSAATKRYMAVGGSEFWYTPTTGQPAARVVHEGAICLVKPGPGKNQWTVSVPRNDFLTELCTDAGPEDAHE